MTLVTEENLAAFERDGVVLVEQAFDADWLDRLETAVDEVMNAPSPLSREYVQTGDGRFFTDHHMSRRNDVFRDFMLSSPASEIAAALLRSDKLNLVDEHLLVKEPGTDVPTYWHHDLPYFEISWQDFASFWIPLDRVTARHPDQPTDILGTQRLRGAGAGHVVDLLFLDGPVQVIHAEPE